MLKLKNILSKAQLLLKDKMVIRTIIAVFIVLIIAALFSWHNNKVLENQQHTALLKLEAQQKALAKQTIKSTTPKSDSISTSQFSDVSNTGFNKPSCPQLENRPGIIITSSDCSYRLRAFGSIRMDVVLVYDQSYSQDIQNQLTNNDPNDQGSLYYVNTYYKNQAARYGVTNPMQLQYTFYGPYKTTQPVDNLYFRDNSEALLSTYQETAASNNVPEQKYDLTQYVLLDSVYGGYAFPTVHQAFTYSSFGVSTFAHETLHLFGATDKYNNNDCDTIGTSDPFGRYGGSQPGRDIMCDNFNLTSIINDITAREIGWAN